MRPTPCPDFLKQNKKKKVIHMVDLSTRKIKELFNEQIKQLTRRSLASDSFDYQFSDRWVRNHA